jgi:hypothetical protein
MSTIEIRNQLHQYIDLANDKKVKAIYIMLGNEIWPDDMWDDDSFIEEMERRVNEIESGAIKPYSWQEVQARAAKASKGVKGY